MSKSREERELLLRDAPVGPAIRSLALSMILGTACMAIYNIVDTYYIGLLKNTYALSAVNIAFPVSAVANAMGLTLGAGVVSSIGRSLGRGGKERADRTAATVIATAYFCGLLMMFAGLFFSEPIFKLFGASDNVLPYANEYGTWMFVGFVFTLSNQSYNNIARAETNAKLGAIAMAIGSIANIILDPIFMFGLHMELEGAALATTLSQMITSSIFVVYYFIRRGSIFRFSWKNIVSPPEIYRDVVVSGAPVGLANLISAFSMTMVNLVAKDFGDYLVAAYGVCLKVLTLGFFIFNGFANGYVPIASYAYGARNRERFYGAFRYSLKVILGLTAATTLLYCFGSGFIIRLFSPDPDVIRVGQYIMIAQTVLYIGVGATQMVTVLFQASGKGLIGSILSASRQGLLFVPALLLFTWAFGETGLLLAQPAADLLTLFMAGGLFLWYRKRLERHFAKQEGGKEDVGDRQGLSD